MLILKFYYKKIMLELVYSNFYLQKNNDAIKTINCNSFLIRLFVTTPLEEEQRHFLNTPAALHHVWCNSVDRIEQHSLCSYGSGFDTRVCKSRSQLTR